MHWKTMIDWSAKLWYSWSFSFHLINIVGHYYFKLFHLALASAMLQTREKVKPAWVWSVSVWNTSHPSREVYLRASGKQDTRRKIVKDQRLSLYNIFFTLILATSESIIRHNPAWNKINPNVPCQNHDSPLNFCNPASILIDKPAPVNTNPVMDWTSHLIKSCFMVCYF